MASTINDEKNRLCRILFDQKETLIHRALVAFVRSPETFGDEIVALNEIDETLRNNCSTYSGPRSDEISH